ncbi:MAG: glycosyl hydrolase 108 family protein [Patescibacteria group bacterium]
MANFETAYKNYILPNEGGYANAPADKGGETYAGIARNFNKDWEGWTLIDFEKKKLKGVAIKNNTKFPAIQYAVEKFYLARWNTTNIGKIDNQEVANLLYDFQVHSGANAIKGIQRVLKISDDGKLGADTLANINKANPMKLHNALLEERKYFLEKLIAQNPSQEAFRAGWMARLEKFRGVYEAAKELVTAAKEKTVQVVTENKGTIGIGLGIGAALLLLYLTTRGDKKPKEADLKTTT